MGLGQLFQTWAKTVGAIGDVAAAAALTAAGGPHQVHGALAQRNDIGGDAQQDRLDPTQDVEAVAGSG